MIVLDWFGQVIGIGLDEWMALSKLMKKKTHNLNFNENKLVKLSFTVAWH